MLRKLCRPRCAAAMIALSTAWTAPADGPPPERVALANARIIPIAGAPIAKGVVLLERGKIAAVGESVEVPYDARVYDCTGKVLMPGLVVAHTYRGMDVANEPRPVTPQLDAADAIDPSQLFFEDCLRLGHTVVHVIPGNNTVIGGLGRVVRPIGLTVAEMTIQDGQFLKVSTSGRFERMQHMAQLREAFMELADYIPKLAESRYEEKQKEDEKDVDVAPAEARKRGLELIRAEDVDAKYFNLLRLTGGVPRHEKAEGPKLAGALGAFVYAGAAMDVAAAVQVAKDNGFMDRAVLVLGGEAYKAVDALKQAALPVVLPPDLIYRETDPLTGAVRETFVARPIHDAGLKFALSPAADDSFAERMLVHQAARCVREGVPRDVALRAITLTPAEMLGLGGRLGSLEAGKDAHVVVFSGDPLDFDSVVEKVFIEGVLAYEREKDSRIQRLLSEGLDDVTRDPNEAADGAGKKEKRE